MPKPSCSRISIIERLSTADAIAGLAQSDGQFHFHLTGGLIGHRVVHLVQRRQQPHPVLEDKAIGLDARLVLVEAQVGVEPRHADVDEGLAQLVVGVGLAETGLVPHLVCQLDDIDVVVVTPGPRLALGGIRADCMRWLGENRRCVSSHDSILTGAAEPPMHFQEESRIVSRSRTVASLESWLTVGDALVAKANGNYAIVKPRVR